VFDGYVYAGTRNDTTGAQLWRFRDGTTGWTPVIGHGFGDGNNVKIESLAVFEGALFAVTANPTTGAEVWRSTDGLTWRQANRDGFGDPHNTKTLWSNASAVFNDSLYIGTYNGVAGGELWKALSPQLFLPLLVHNN
jgi:hypothetical protein